MEKKNKRNDQVKVKNKWRCPTEVIKKGESKKHNKRKERYYNSDSKSLEL